MTAPIGATVLGFPRIGRNRQLKRALEAYWSGRKDLAALNLESLSVRLDALYSMSGAGITSYPVNTFSWYDQMLDTAVMVGAVPPRFAGIDSADQLAGFPAARYFAMARGADGVPPLEMTKWFDTNYHHLVPEIAPGTVFSLRADKPLGELGEVVARRFPARVVVIGPWTFLKLSKAADGSPDDFDPMSRIDDLTEVYAELLPRLREAGAGWVQIDEPAMVRDLDPGDLDVISRAYDRLADVADRPAIMVATYFGDPVEALPVLAATRIEAIGLDLVSGPPEPRDVPGLADKTLVLGVVDGRNVWRADLPSALAKVRAWSTLAGRVAVSTSCSLLHVPYSLSQETALSPALRELLAFADEKLAEVVALWSVLDGEALPLRSLVVRAPGRARDDVASRLAAVRPGDRNRADRSERVAAQRARLGLPLLPTTTIGSFPQTDDLRRARAAHRAGRLDGIGYSEAMRGEVATVIALQEALGLDVLVHGEPERNDMVQYFAEQLDGYAATDEGWVQSYGSRCVRPPILYGDVTRPRPMTVEWATYAQSLTDRPVKGMLTGPVTMLAWSFVRDDQPLSVTADQVALALRDEVDNLVAAGIAIVQVDEPALRELLPLRRAGQPAYLDWAVGAFRLATSGAPTDVQIHTHLCYSEFGEIVEAIDALNADVTSIEAARSGMELLADVRERGFHGALGPGVYDIHSPRVPDLAEVRDLIERALRAMPPELLWVNPDCGLKTRRYEEVDPALEAIVTAANQVRAALG